MKLRKPLIRMLQIGGIVFGFTMEMHCHAQMVYGSMMVEQMIPDGDLAGMSQSITINAPANVGVAGVTVTLNITGDSMGDLYGSLFHNGKLAVLLNRVGRTHSDSSGYLDSQLDVTFGDAGDMGDIHNYRLILTGSANVAPIGPVTGSWAPDGRNINPIHVLDTSPRNALLSNFIGTEANGTWTLFLADVDSGGQNRLNSWSLQIVPVPEPAGTTMAAGAMLCLFVFVVRRLRERGANLNRNNPHWDSQAASE